MLADLIAAVLAEHRTDGSYTRQCDADMWHWWCACGARNTRPPGQGQNDVDLHVAGAIANAIQESQPDHLIELRADESWVVQHSMACRLTGQLFDCPYTRARTVAADGYPWPPPGRYRCTLDHGWLRIGEAVSANA